MSKDEGEIIRKKYFYRKLIMEGKIRLSATNAKKIIGPDIAFHLYSHEDKDKKS